MRTILHVLSIGSPDASDCVRDALHLRRRCQLFVAASYKDLCAIPGGKSLEVAVLHQSLSNRQLRELSEHIRRYWPMTRILVIHPNSEVIDDPLFDEWARPGQTAEVLLLIIERLARDARLRRKTAGPSRSAGTG